MKSEDKMSLNREQPLYIPLDDLISFFLTIILGKSKTDIEKHCYLIESGLFLRGQI